MAASSAAQLSSTLAPRGRRFARALAQAANTRRGATASCGAAPHSALAMNHWLEQAHGYYGQYLYGLPAEVRLRQVRPFRGAAHRDDVAAVQRDAQCAARRL